MAAEWPHATASPSSPAAAAAASWFSSPAIFFCSALGGEVVIDGSMCAPVAVLLLGKSLFFFPFFFYSVGHRLTGSDSNIPSRGLMKVMQMLICIIHLVILQSSQWHPAD
jgi:hypothetical protein